ncbi:MAG: PHB depolymerase family esterase [Deltaproteobacteria bacterium]|nr:PHB depolymerase family esterase [Deltaproteobacteria bacterium]
MKILLWGVVCCATAGAVSCAEPSSPLRDVSMPDQSSPEDSATVEPGDVAGSDDADDAGDASAEPDGEASADAVTPPSDSPSTSGCGRAPGTNDRTWTVTHQGRERSFVVHLPSGYDRGRQTPMVLNFHGRNSDAAQQIWIAQMTAKADRAGFIVVHPQGIGATWNAGFCCGEAQASNIDDVGFARAMLDSLSVQLCLDRRRVYATGLSNGAIMAHRLGCDLSDRIAAIAPVAGGNQTVSCSPRRPVPVQAYHGSADTVVPYAGFAGQFSIPATMSDWRVRNRCGATPSQSYLRGDVRCEVWSGCASDASVELCTVTGGGHQWPGGNSIPLLGNNTTNVSATERMWDFFTAHPLP